MYEPLVILHSWLRWAVLVAGLVAVARAVGGARSARPWSTGDDAAGRWFVITLDVQLLIGLILYVFLSPLTQTAMADMAAAMQRSDLRFWGVEHVTGMVVGVALAHVGRVRIRRQAAGQHRTAAIFFGLALLVILLSIPWPGMPVARPLFRLFT